MKLNLFLILIFSFVLSQSKIYELTETKEKLLILPSDNKIETIESTLTDLVSSEATNLNRFEIIDRNILQKILTEQKLQMSGIILEDQIVNYGQIASADEALIISILSFGQKGVPPKEKNSNDKKEKKYWDRVGVEITLGIVRTIFSNKTNSNEKYPYNIQTSLQAEIRKIDVETGQSIHSFRVHGEHTGGTKAASLNKVLNQIRGQISTKLRKMFLLKSEILDREGSNLTMLLGTDIGIKKGSIFEIMKSDVLKNIDGREFILPGKSVGLVRITNIGSNVSEGKIIRQFREIKKGFSLVEKPQHFGGLIFKGVYNKSIDEKRLDVGYEFFPFSRFSFTIGGAAGVLTDSRKDVDFKTSLIGEINLRLIHTRFFSFGTSLNIPLSLIFRKDDQPQNVHKFQFNPTVGFNTEFLISKTTDVIFGFHYLLLEKSDLWVYTEGNGNDSINLHGEWNDGIAPEINPKGIYFSLGIRFINY